MNDHHEQMLEGPHGSLKDYLTGFALSVVLTAIPFALVMTGALSAGTTLWLLLALAVVQIFVHMIYFLHMTFDAEKGWTVLTLVFTLILVCIALIGSLWVMHHLDVNMMPGMMDASSGPA